MRSCVSQETMELFKAPFWKEPLPWPTFAPWRTAPLFRSGGRGCTKARGRRESWPKLSGSIFLSHLTDTPLRGTRCFEPAVSHSPFFCLGRSARRAVISPWRAAALCASIEAFSCISRAKSFMPWISARRRSASLCRA
jgi:hypothetical protein